MESETQESFAAAPYFLGQSSELVITFMMEKLSMGRDEALAALQTWLLGTAPVLGTVATEFPYIAIAYVLARAGHLVKQEIKVDPAFDPHGVQSANEEALIAAACAPIVA